eukprot:13589273-Alexandrium_andersonii.AAC.1
MKRPSSTHLAAEYVDTPPETTTPPPQEPPQKKQKEMKKKQPDERLRINVKRSPVKSNELPPPGPARAAI